MVLTGAVVAMLMTTSYVLGQAQSPTQTPAMTSQQPQLSKDSEQRYLKDAASDSNLEIELGSYVQTKSIPADVKQLAQMMVNDHQHVKQQIQEVAGKTGNKISADHMEKSDHATLDHFKDLPDTDLAREYTFFLIGNHQRDFLNSQYVGNHASDSNIRNFAQGYANSLQQHLQHSEQVAQASFGSQFPGFAQPAGGTMHDHGQTGGNSGHSGY
jgi:predicted outer membrane protein